MRWFPLTLLAVLLLPGVSSAADHPAGLPDPYHRTWAVSGRNPSGAVFLRTIRLSYHQTEKIRDMAAQMAKEKERYIHGDYTRVGEPTIRQNCAGLVTDRLGPALLSRPFVASAQDLFEILKTFGEPVSVLRTGDVAVWTRDGKEARHVGVVIGRTATLKPIILTKDGEESPYEFVPARIPVTFEDWFQPAFVDDLDPLVQAYGPPQFWRCDLKALHWEELAFRGVWSDAGGGTVEAIPVPEDPEAFVLKRLTPDDRTQACELIGRFRILGSRPDRPGALAQARGTMACRSLLSHREQCGEMAQWVEGEAWIQAGPPAAGRVPLELRTSTACPGFKPCRWEIGPSEPRPGAYHRPPADGPIPPACPETRKEGGKPLLFLHETNFETFDPPNKRFIPGREGKGQHSWWKADDRSFHQEHDKGLIVDASWDPMPPALVPLQKYAFTFRAKAAGPGYVDFGLYPVGDTGSWSITLKESSEGVRHPSLNVWILRVGTKEGEPIRPEGWMTLEIQVAGTSDKIDMTNMAVIGGTGDLDHVTNLFLTLDCMYRNRITWGWSKAK